MTFHGKRLTESNISLPLGIERSWLLLLMSPGAAYWIKTLHCLSSLKSSFNLKCFFPNCVSKDGFVHKVSKLLNPSFTINPRELACIELSVPYSNKRS